MDVPQRRSRWLNRAVREHWLPLLILVAPVAWVVWQSDADNALPFLPLPLAALAIGYVYRPRHVWILWLGSVITEWAMVGLFGKFGDLGSGETIASIMVEAFGWMFIGVLIPAWIGRLLRGALIDLGQDLRLQEDT